jgi:glycosyltransferase involved in cell wall biosynthesis
MREVQKINLKERLAIFVPSMRGGGAERIALNLAGGVVKRGYCVDLVLAQAEGSYLAQVPDAVRIIDLGSSRVSLSLPALAAYLRRERPQALLSEMGHANVVALWARRLVGIPRRVVVCNHLIYRNAPAQHASSWRVRLMPRLAKRFYPWADGIVAVSSGVADGLAQVTGIPRECIEVIYNPVVTPEVREKAQAPFEHPWFGPSKPPVILGMGRLTAQKDFPALIQAFAQVRQSRQVRLMILGEGEDRPPLEALVRELGLEKDVALPGFVDNPYAYLTRASLFVLSSRWEGLPTVLIEALYCGVPSIATDCPDGPREILADGQYGQLVPIGDAAALARAIETSLESETPPAPRESWRPFELEAVVNQYISMLFGN